MIALYRKELRQLWPIALLGFLLFSGDLFYRPFTEYLDQASWEEIASYVDPAEDGGFGWFVIVLAVATAYSAFPREHDEHTIDFLLSLPLRPRTVFVAKVAAGLTLAAIRLRAEACASPPPSGCAGRSSPPWPGSCQPRPRRAEARRPRALRALLSLAGRPCSCPCAGRTRRRNRAAGAAAG